MIIYLVLVRVDKLGINLIQVLGDMSTNPDVTIKTQDHINSTGQRMEMRFTALNQCWGHSDKRSIPELAVLQTAGVERVGAISEKRLHLCHNQIALHEETAHLQLVRLLFSPLEVVSISDEMGVISLILVNSQVDDPECACIHNSVNKRQSGGSRHFFFT
jgi:hypothetical protein